MFLSVNVFSAKVLIKDTFLRPLLETGPPFYVACLISGVPVAWGRRKGKSAAKTAGVHVFECQCV